jgi:hypothetical protein
MVPLLRRSECESLPHDEDVTYYPVVSGSFGDCSLSIKKTWTSPPSPNTLAQPAGVAPICLSFL